MNASYLSHSVTFRDSLEALLATTVCFVLWLSVNAILGYSPSLFAKKGDEKVMLKSSFLVSYNCALIPPVLSMFSYLKYYSVVSEKWINHSTILSTLFSLPGGEPVPSCTGQKVGYASSKPPPWDTYSTSLPVDNSKCPVQLTCMYWDVQRKLEHPRRHAEGRNISCREGTILTTEALCRSTVAPLFI